MNAKVEIVEQYANSTLSPNMRSDDDADIRIVTDQDIVLQILNEVLANELAGALRYRRHAGSVEGLLANAMRQEFLARANQKQNHADILSERIRNLGGKPNLEPAALAYRSHAAYSVGTTLENMLAEDLIEERVAIDALLAMVEYLEGKDRISQAMLRSILAAEQQYAKEAKCIIDDLRRIAAKRRIEIPVWH